MLLVPVLIGLVLFIEGRVNFMWSLTLVGILCWIIADTGFLLLTLDDSYYTGHPMEIFYLAGYVLFSFGIYDQIKLFSKRPSIGRQFYRRFTKEI